QEDHSHQDAGGCVIDLLRCYPVEEPSPAVAVGSTDRGYQQLDCLTDLTAERFGDFRFGAGGSRKQRRQCLVFGKSEESTGTEQGDEGFEEDRLRTEPRCSPGCPAGCPAYGRMHQGKEVPVGFQGQRTSHMTAEACRALNVRGGPALTTSSGRVSAWWQDGDKEKRITIFRVDEGAIGSQGELILGYRANEIAGNVFDDEIISPPQ